MNHQAPRYFLTSVFSNTVFFNKLGLLVVSAVFIVALQACGGSSDKSDGSDSSAGLAANKSADAAASVSSYKLLNAPSQIRFISVKKSAIAESHRFGEFEGFIDESGQASISIALDSVETLIPIRNERMREFLFETSKFPMATITASVDPLQLSELAVGEQWQVDLPITVDLHGNSKSYTQAVELIRLANGHLQLHSLQPVLINAADFDLLAGIDKLAELANLPSIATAVPVEVLLVFAAN